MSKIEITIHRDGQVDLELFDFQDSSCLDITRRIEHLLGNEITNRKYLHDHLSESINPRQKDQLTHLNP